jgi:hypothetical protein
MPSKPFFILLPLTKLSCACVFLPTSSFFHHYCSFLFRVETLDVSKLLKLCVLTPIPSEKKCFDAVFRQSGAYDAMAQCHIQGSLVSRYTSASHSRHVRGFDVLLHFLPWVSASDDVSCSLSSPSHRLHGIWQFLAPFSPPDGVLDAIPINWRGNKRLKRHEPALVRQSVASTVVSVHKG